MRQTEVTKIPAPGAILKGEWNGIVYAIETTEETEEAHKANVERVIEQLEDDFDKKNHSSVSLRVVKKEIVYNDPNFERIITLVQFRVRDSY